MWRGLQAFVFAATLSSTAESAELLSVDVAYEEGLYSMRSEVWFDARIEQVYHVFRHWDYSQQFSSAIVDSRDLAEDEQGRAQFFVSYKGCVLFFCKSFKREGYVDADENVLLAAFADPEKSDFHFSDERWEFSSRDGGTVVVYDLKMSPRFWVPPGIGPYFIKRKLKKSGGAAIDRIELIAQGIENE